MFLKEAIELFLGDYIPTTRASYAQVMLDFQRHLGDSFILEDITPVDLKRYIQVVDRRPTITSPHTYNKYIKTLKVFFNWCVGLELFQRSPAEKAIKRKSADRKVRKEKDMQNKELDALIGLAQHEPRLLTLVLFAAETGARRRGMALLTWKDVNIREGYAYVTEKGRHRKVKFGDYTKMCLTYWKTRPDQQGQVVFSEHGTAISPEALGQYFRRRCIKAGCRSLGLHSLRHRLGHLLVENHPLSVAAEVLGHRNKQVTADYYSPDDEPRVDAAREQFFIKLPSFEPFSVVPRKPEKQDRKQATGE